MAIEYFCCYHSYRRKLERLSDEEVGRLFRALLEYSETGCAPELTGRECMAFDFIIDDIDRSRQKYADRCAMNAEKGRMGGRGRKAAAFSESRESQYKDKDKSKYKCKSESKYKDDPMGDMAQMERLLADLRMDAAAMEEKEGEGKA